MLLINKNKDLIPQYIKRNSAGYTCHGPVNVVFIAYVKLKYSCNLSIY